MIPPPALPPCGGGGSGGGCGGGGSDGSFGWRKGVSRRRASRGAHVSHAHTYLLWVEGGGVDVAGHSRIVDWLVGVLQLICHLAYLSFIHKARVFEPEEAAPVDVEVPSCTFGKVEENSVPSAFHHERRVSHGAPHLLVVHSRGAHTCDGVMIQVDHVLPAVNGIFPSACQLPVKNCHG